MDDGFLYHYKAIVVSVYDGDTITVDIDLGLKTWRLREKIRLYGIDTPELRGPDRQKGLMVRDWLRNRLPVGSAVELFTYKDRTGKYGRWLAEVFVGAECVNDELLQLGLARKVDW